MWPNLEKANLSRKTILITKFLLLCSWLAKPPNLVSSLMTALAVWKPISLTSYKITSE